MATVLAGLASWAFGAPDEAVPYDIVIYGSSPAAISAEKDMAVQDVPYAELRKRLLDDKQVLAIVRR